VTCDPRNIGVGDQLGAYRIEELLGKGGMAMVFRGHDLKLQRRVAIKVMFPEFAAQEGGRERFLREGRAAARLAHPNVVYMLDVDVEGETPYFVMEYLVGEDVRALLHRMGTLSVEQATSIVAPVARALSAAHAAGIVHRDLKPENIFLARQPDGSVIPKILDFGISRVQTEAFPDDRVKTATGMLLGTPHYMSPEQVRGAKLAVPASDQYSLGVVLYEMLTGTKPFAGDSLFSLLNNIVQGQFRSPRSLRPDLPAAADRVIRRAMHRDVAGRYEDVAMLAEALDALRAPMVVADLAQITRETRRSNLPTLADGVRHSVPSLDTPRAGTSLPVVLPRNRFPWPAVAAGVLCLGAVFASALSFGDSAPGTSASERSVSGERASAGQPVATSAIAPRTSEAEGPLPAMPASAPLTPRPLAGASEATDSPAQAALAKRSTARKTGKRRALRPRVASGEVRLGANDSLILDVP